MWIDRLLSSRPRHALELTARFAEARHQVLAENVANIDTPDYQTRRLDGREFQQTLRKAIDEARSANKSRLELRGSRQVSTDSAGRLVAQPQTEPAANVLFHDGTNARLEELMTQVSENALTYQFALARLKSSFDGLKTAIRGRLS